MIYITILLLLLILLLCSIFYTTSRSNRKSSPWLDTRSYPQITNVYQNRDQIRKELDSLIDKNVWTIWRNGYEPSPTFTKMKREEILQKIKNGSSGINKESKSWKLFGLVLKGEPIDDNLKRCPKTKELLQKVPGLINAGFSVLEPKSRIDKHRGYDGSFYRVHIPMITPEGDCCLKVNGYTRKWRDSEYFIFDDTLEHEAWNNTDKVRIVLILDIERHA